MENLHLDALQDDWGANAFEEVLRHLHPVLADLRSGNRDSAARERISAFGAQLQASAEAGVMGITSPLEMETRVLLPLLNNYLADLKA